ncbi:unnamed protein product [Owenia fusiformis]|uniref:Amine oxidase n=1 Tax=Owenia fusiformis TaxID=6347 RepID=A0A8S4Q967_OWEFU|nr:unnamed protein product [Owenia fusiformis]
MENTGYELEHPNGEAQQASSTINVPYNSQEDFEKDTTKEKTAPWKNTCLTACLVVTVALLIAALAAFGVVLWRLVEQENNTSTGVNGNWGEWGDWGECNKTCGDGGVRNRSRSCSDPSPEHGGDACPGSGVEHKTCTLPNCSTELDLGEACKPGYTCGDPNAECRDDGDGEKCTCKVTFVQKQFNNVQACTETTTRTASVLILGGGMAGVMAAKTLHEAGITDYIIIEAQPRLGGRISDIKWNGYTLEQGATWIHGLDGNPMWDLAQKYNLSGFITDYEDYIARDANGNDVTEEFDLAYERLLPAQEFEYDLTIDKLENNSSDITKKVALRLGGWSAKSSYDYAAQYYDYDYDYAEDIDILSLRYNLLNTYEDFGDGDYHVLDSRGYRHLVQATADEFLNGTNLMLNKTVSKVDTLPNRVRVTLQSGEKLEASYAIMTFSIGVLQNELITFEPPLSSKKNEAIHSFQLSPYKRTVLKFPYAFWDENEFIVHTPETPGHYVIWENYNHAKIYPGSNIIMSTLTGDEVRRVALLTEAEIVAENMGVLRSMYGAGIPDPESALISSWEDNPTTMGAYSSWPIGFNSDDHDVMRSPIRNLHFAGEHNNARYNGCTHAGYFSGVETATQVVQCIEYGC